MQAWDVWSSTLLPLIWSYGGELFSEDGTELLLNSPETEKALQYYYDLVFKHNVHPKPGAGQATFEAGKIGMYKAMYSFVSTARAIEDFEWDIAPLPEGPNGQITLMGYAGYSVFAGTKHPEEAMEFLKFISSKEAMATTSQYFVPSRKSVLESEVFKKPGGQPSPESIQSAVLDQMKTARLNTGHVNWAQIDDKIQTLLDMLNTQSASVKDVLENIEKEATPLLK